MSEGLARALNALSLDRLGIDAFEHLAWLPLLFLVAALALFAASRARSAAIPWPGLAEARAAGGQRFDASRVVGLALRAGALAALAVALAGPVGVHRAPPEPGYGLDLLLVVDASGSMRAKDAEVDGVYRTRLDLAREVVSRFAEQRAAEGDRVGLVVFGESAFTQCPLTSDGALLRAALGRIEAGVAGEATALGDALALAVKRVLGTRGGTEAGRVVVLLTDGRNNAGAVPMEVATALAKSAGVRVHTVGIGTRGEAVPMEGGRGLRLERHDVDRRSLDHIASVTGGRFFPARRSEELHAVYGEIDALERVSRPLPPRVRRTQRAEPLLALAGGFLLFEIAAVRVLRRRLP